MHTLTTARLLLVPTPLRVIESRLRGGEFTAEISVGGVLVPVRFPEEWPGDAIALFPGMTEQLKEDPGKAPWGGTMIDRQKLVAVGQMSFKGLPDETGTVELGYGVNPSFQNLGYATEMAGELVAWAWKQPEIKRVTAECLEDNAGSIRVLEKVGFQRIGEREDEEGHLVLWQQVMSREV